MRKFALILLVVLAVVLNCKAAKFARRSSMSSFQGKQIRKNFPFAANVAKKDDCDFCVDYMLEDCFCEDVEFCRSKGCYVPDYCTNC